MNKKLMSLLAVTCVMVLVIAVQFGLRSKRVIVDDKIALDMQQVQGYDEYDDDGKWAGKNEGESKEALERKQEKLDLGSQHEKRVEGEERRDNPNLFAQWHNDIRTPYGAERPDYALNYQVDQLLKARGVKSTRELASLKGTQQLSWQERGPGNVSGRTRSILVDPNDADFDTWIAGSVGGGVWKTEDAGQSWVHLTADLPNLATSTLAWSPSNTDIIYVGTGEGFGNVDQIDGSGIWKTTDGGATWTQLISTTTNPDFENVTRIVVDPADPDIVVASVTPGFNHFVAPTSGIYRSDDGGATWTKTYDSGTASVEHLIANPLRFNTQYASRNSVGVVKSTDGGLTWTDASEGIGAVARLELAIAYSDTNYVYASAQGGASGSILYGTTDGGANWQGFNDETGTNIHWLAGQGWYDNTIAVNPFDETEVFVGGVNIWRLNTVAGTDTTDPQVTGIDTENTENFLAFVNWGGSYAGGGIDTGNAFHGLPTGVTQEDFTTVEIRFGPGKSQKAHRFLFAASFQYPYQDYVDVPFEVWDVDNNQQLMFSFRDDEDNGVFELEDRLSDLDGSGIDREYMFIHAIPYDAANPDTNIAKTAGMAYKNTFAIWPEAPGGAGVVDLSSLTEDATLRINWGTFVTRRLQTSFVTDVYGQFGGTGKGVHPDQHNLVLVMTDAQNGGFRLINGNDGGISYSDDDGATFFQTGNQVSATGYNTSQFYGVDKANGVDRYIGGTQDNGSWYSEADPDETSAWLYAPSGDGFEALWHYNNADQMIESIQFNNLRRTLDGGANWANVSPPDVGGGAAPFFTKLAKSKQDPDLTFAVGASGVWRTDNFADIWTLAPMGNGFSGTSSFSQVKISLVNPQIVWTAQSMTPGSPPFLSTDGGLTFSPTNVYTEATMNRISGFETHPLDDSTAYALSSVRARPKILRTQDLGQTWEDISGFGTDETSSSGFPDVAVYSLLVMPFDTNWLWAGTEIGLFESSDGGASWAYADNGLPAVGIYEMVIVNDEVVVATHGRGVWSVALPQLSGYEPPSAVLAPRFVSIGGGANGAIVGSALFPSAYDSAAVRANGEAVLTVVGNDAGLEQEIDVIVEFEAPRDTVEVDVIAWKDGKSYRSPKFPIELFDVGAARAFYATDFSEAAEDFDFSGLEIAAPPAFNSPGLHSAHPYPDGPSGGTRDDIAQLKFPIIVSNTNSMISFDEIAIVEPGNPGVQWPAFGFWDYVVVEGSLDGGSWIALEPGYDARRDPDWESAFNDASPGDPSMYRAHMMDLSATFNEGDEVLIRFRLNADEAANGWGWAIDNLAIQTDPVSVKDGEQLPTVFSLSQNYPNPFNPTTSINYALPKDAEVSLQIFNVLGQKVKDLVFGEKQSAGRYTIQWDGRDDTGRHVSSGLYFYKIRAGEFTKSFKMTLLK